MSELPTDDHMPTWELLHILRLPPTQTPIPDELVRNIAADELERLEADNRTLRMTIAESLRLIAQTLRSGEVRLDDVVNLLARANSEVSDE